MYELSLQSRFSAAHHLRDYHGKCERLHGHNYLLEIALAGRELNELGMLIDFKDARKIADDVVGRLDHEYLNELEPFDRMNPTTEHIAEHVARQVQRRLPQGLRVKSVRCWESDTCAARYVPEDAAPGQDAEC